MDIFRGWENHAEKIKYNWNSLVSDYDTVVIPGDVSWAMKLEDALIDFKFINELPGKKIILKGNHDYWWNSITKMNAFLSDNGLDTISFIHNSAIPVGDFAVCGSRGWFFETEGHSKKIINREAGRIDSSITAAESLGLEPLVFLHYPPVWMNQVCAEIIDVLKAHNIHEVWHGHIHGFLKQYLNYSAEGISFHLVSCDCLNFAPILIK